MGLSSGFGFVVCFVCFGVFCVIILLFSFFMFLRFCYFSIMRIHAQFHLSTPSIPNSSTNHPRTLLSVLMTIRLTLPISHHSISRYPFTEVISCSTSPKFSKKQTPQAFLSPRSSPRTPVCLSAFESGAGVPLCSLYIL
jgi:hypothetical protein